MADYLTENPKMLRKQTRQLWAVAPQVKKIGAEGAESCNFQ